MSVAIPENHRQANFLVAKRVQFTTPEYPVATRTWITLGPSFQQFAGRIQLAAILSQLTMRHLSASIIGLFIIGPSLQAQTPDYAWALFAGNIGGQQASGRAIAADRDGNVFVAGVGAPSITWGSFALTNSQQYIMKANNAGTVLWAKKIPVRPDHLATDNAGNVYLSAAAQGPVVLDGDSIPGDYSMPSAVLVKYDPQGNVLWFRNHTASSDAAVPGRVMCDASDNVYLCGAFNSSITIEGITYTGDPANGGAVFAVSYTSDGIYRRSNATTSLPPTASLNSMPNAACDTACAIFRGGPFGGVEEVQVGDFTLEATSEQTPAYNAYLIKWDSDGQVAWAHASGGIGTEDVTSVVVDGRGHVVVSGGFTGHFFDPDSATVFGRRLFLQSQAYNLQDMYVASFTPDGVVEWIKRSGGNHVDAGARLAVDAMDNVYAFGNGLSGLMTFDDLVVYPYSGSYLVKYDRDGDVKWAKLMAAGQGGGNNCYGASADQWGNVYVTGMQSDTIRLDAFENITPAQNNFDVFAARLNNCAASSSELFADGPLVFCPGDSVGLGVPENAAVLWNTGAATSAITVNSSGAYFAITADLSGCFTRSDTVIVDLFDVSVPSVVFENDQLSCTPATSYQWFLDGVSIPGANGQSFIPLENGNYSVETTDANGCVSVSEEVVLTSVGITEQFEQNDRVYSLGDGRVRIELSTPADDLTVFDARGHLVWRSVRLNSSTLVIHVDAAGVYLLRCQRDGVVRAQRFVLTR